VPWSGHALAARAAQGTAKSERSACNPMDRETTAPDPRTDDEAGRSHFGILNVRTRRFLHGRRILPPEW